MYSLFDFRRVTKINIGIEIKTNHQRPAGIQKFYLNNSEYFHIFAQNILFGYSLEPPRRGGSNEYPQSMFLSRNKKIMYSLERLKKCRSSLERLKKCRSYDSSFSTTD